MDLIYLNNASTTMVDKNVIKDFTYAAEKYWANPSDISDMGLSSKEVIKTAQKQIADSINSNPEEIVFTSGGSESNNWAIKGYCSANDVDVIITTEIEHPSVYNTCRFCNDYGVEIAYTPVDCNGMVDLEEFESIISTYRDRHPYYKILVSIMFANNEIGTIQPIKKIAETTHKYNAVLHVDAVQAYMHTKIDVKDLEIDMMSTSFHKIGGFKNCGFLYVRDGINLDPLIHGGHQFNSRRSGTENVPMIYAMGNLVEKLLLEIGHYEEHMNVNWKYCIHRLTEHVDFHKYDFHINGSYGNRMRNNLSLTIKSVNAEMLIALLELEGIYVSAGSACCSGEKTPSRVLKAIGLSDEDAFSTIRISFGTNTTFDMIDCFIEKLFICLNGMKMIENFGDGEGE